MSRIAEDFEEWCKSEGGKVTPYGEEIGVPECNFGDDYTTYDDWIEDQNYDESKLQDWTQHVFDGTSGDDWAYMGVPDRVDMDIVAERTDVDELVEELEDNKLSDGDIRRALLASYVAGMDLYGEHISGLSSALSIPHKSWTDNIKSIDTDEYVKGQAELMGFDEEEEHFAAGVRDWSHMWGVSTNGDTLPIGIVDDLREVDNEVDGTTGAIFVGGEQVVVFGTDVPRLSGNINHRKREQSDYL